MVMQEKTFTGSNEITPINATDESRNTYDYTNEEKIIYRNSVEKLGTLSGNKLDLETYFIEKSLNNGSAEEYNLEREEASMDENKILEKYMDKVDQDRRDQEQRLSKNMESMRSDLNEDRKLMEQRITEERRLSEERMEKSFKEAMESIKSTNNKIEGLETKLDQKTDRMLDKIDSTNKWMIGTCIATILAIAAIAASVWFK